MLDKTYLEEKITATFPDIYNSKFEINGKKVSTFTESNLLPYLIYQNTIDKKHRLIGLYLSENTNIINLVPFYILMGQLRKALNNVMVTKGFQNQSYKSDEVQIIYNSSIGNVTAVDFINSQIALRFGMGNEKKIPFNNSYGIKPYNSKSETLLNNLYEFDRISKADKTNIFTFPVTPSTDQYEGVIMFSNTSKFESLIRNLRVSDDDLRSNVNIEKITFPADGSELKFTRISAPNTKIKPVSILIARQDSYRAYSSILLNGGKRLNHIKTIIIDDFDELILRWLKADKLNEELTWLKDELFSLVTCGEIKDLYLICKNSNINIHEILKKNDIEYHSWLIKPNEVELLDEEILSSPKVDIIHLNEVEFEDLNKKINDSLFKWKEFGKGVNVYIGEIINIISCLYELRIKLNSFNDLESTSVFLEKYLQQLKEIKAKWFSADQDHGLIEDTISLIMTCCNLGNFKLTRLINILQEEKEIKSIKIVSDNKNEEDISWVVKSIKSLFPNLIISHSSKKNSLIHIEEYCKPEIIFYLTANKNIIGNVLGNVLAETQVFILNKNEFDFSEYYSKKYQQLQLEIGSAKKKYELLNINPPFNKVIDETRGLLNIKYVSQLPEEKPFEEKNQIEDLSSLIEDILIKHACENTYICAKCILFFDDGSYNIFPETKRIYLYEDEKEHDDIDKSFKTASELEPGNQVIITRKQAPLKEILENSFKKDINLSRSMDIDSKWRILINNHIIRCKMDLNYFRKKLHQNGFVVMSDQTVQNWIDGETRRPEKFQKLLDALASMSILNKNEIELYCKHNLELKDLQLRFVRTAVRNLIARLNGIINLKSNTFSDELLNDFINHIEIKRITSIHKL